MAARRGKTGGWSELFITSSLAAAITTAGSFLIDRGKVGSETIMKRCEIAQKFLSDETPTAYMDEVTRQRMTRAAAGAFARCMEER